MNGATCKQRSDLIAPKRLGAFGQAGLFTLLVFNQDWYPVISKTTVGIPPGIR